MQDEVFVRIQEILSSESMDANFKIEKIKRAVLRYESFNETLDSPLPLKEALQEMLLKLTDSNKRPLVIPTGIHPLDSVIQGLQAGEFVVIGARPAMGKTAFMITLAKNFAGKVPLLYINLECSRMPLVQRFVACASQIEISKIMNGNLSAEEWKRLDIELGVVEKMPLYFYDFPMTSLFSLEQLIRREVAEKDIKIVFLDHIQLIGLAYSRNRDQELGLICRTLKRLAMELNISIVANSQLSRNSENRGGFEGKRPQLSDLRDSGALEQFADIVMFIHRPEYYKITEDPLSGNSLLGIAEIIVAKNRRSYTGDVQLRFKPHFALFEEIVEKSFTEINAQVNPYLDENSEMMQQRIKEIDSTIPF